MKIFGEREAVSKNENNSIKKLYFEKCI